MPKGYWVAQVNVRDKEAYEKYKSANAVAFKKFGGRFVIRGGSQIIKEGCANPRTVVIEFETYQKALDCYDSAEYRLAFNLRNGISEGNLVIVEGVSS